MTAVTPESASLLVADLDLPRRTTLKLYLNAPTADDPAGDWNIEKNIVARPTLELPVADEPLDATIDQRTDETDAFDSQTDGMRIDFELDEDLPDGIPLQFTLQAVEDTEDGRTYNLGTTQPFTIIPGEDNAITIERSNNGYEPLEYSSKSDVFLDRDATDDGYRIRMAAGTNDTRYHAPSQSGIPNRNDEFGFEDYKRGAFERPWGIEYEISEDEHDAALRHWKMRYKHSGGDEDQLDVMWRYYLDGGEEWGVTHDTLEPIERLAEQFAEKAELLGFETPEEKVRFVADIIQWMEYETDEERRWRDLPEVQHPVNFFSRGRGDCIDKVVAATSLLYQDPFPDYVMDKYYIFRNPYRGGIFQTQTEHIGLTIESDIFTTDLGGPQVSDDDGYSYIEITYPGPLGAAYPGNEDLELVDISDAWPGY
ncbi:hypothetical protein [Natronobacterium texcoconense]|nr:hypothetical protein [Natronobacterium texcoconense]